MTDRAILAERFRKAAAGWKGSWLQEVDVHVEVGDLQAIADLLEAKGTADAVRAKLADDLDEQRRLEETTADGEPDNMGETWHSYAQFFIDHHDVITAALRSLPAVTGGEPWIKGEREAVARAIFGDGWQSCANLGPYVQAAANELNDARELIEIWDRTQPDLAEKWRDLIEQRKSDIALPAPKAAGDETSKLYADPRIPPTSDARAAVIEAAADAIDAARYQHPDHPRERPRPFSEADRGDREYAFRLARAALSQAPATDGAAVTRPKLGGAA